MAFLKKYWLILGLPIIIVLASLLAIRIVNSIDYRNNDFFTFWLAGHLVIKGGNPYDSTQWLAGHHEFGVTWIPNQAYVYPLPLSLLSAPLGLLPLKTAYMVWVALSELMILGSLALLVFSRADQSLRKFLFPVLMGLILFRPAVLTLINGQISAWLLLILAAVVYLWEHGYWEWGSLLLPLLMLKPNLGVPILALVGLWLLVKKQYRSIGLITLGLVALLLIGFLQNPHWVSDYWSIGNVKVSQNIWGGPTLWGLGFLVCAHNASHTLIFGGFTSLLLISAYVWFIVLRWKDISAFTLMSLTVVVTLLVTPYMWTYEQLLLLLPVLDLIWMLSKKGSRFLVSSILFLEVDLLMVILLVFNTLLKIESFNAIVPLFLLGLYAHLRRPSARRAPAPVLERI